MIKTWPDSQAVLWLGALELGRELAEQFVYAQFAQGLTAENNKNHALLKAGNHPDFRILVPEETDKPIKIDQIRDLQEWVMAKPLIGPEKIAILLPGDALNIQAANAFLKTLEEPPSYARFILICQKYGHLPLTVRSRCQIVREESLDPEYAKLARRENGIDQNTAELEALKPKILQDLADIKSNRRNPIEVAEAWAKMEVGRLLHTLLVICSESLSQNMEKGQALPGQAWWSWCDELWAAKRNVDQRINLNKQLLMEMLLIKFVGMA